MYVKNWDNAVGTEKLLLCAAVGQAELWALALASSCLCLALPVPAQTSLS